jgi:hypothetical protein
MKGENAADGLFQQPASVVFHSDANLFRIVLAQEPAPRMPLLEDKSVIPEGFIGNPESYPLDSRFRGNDNPKYVSKANYETLH